jgi:hypothetical protein
MTTKAIPVSRGIGARKASRASRPPADAPIPTIGKSTGASPFGLIFFGVRDVVISFSSAWGKFSLAAVILYHIIIAQEAGSVHAK